MIEQGLVALIQSGLTGLSPAVLGGFADILPKDQIAAAAPLAWTYRTIVSAPTYALNAQLGWTDWEVQIDCHGFTAAHAVILMRAIDLALRGFRGTLPDSDHTYVFQIVRDPAAPSGFSDANRSYVRSLEYTVSYQQV